MNDTIPSAVPHHPAPPSPPAGATPARERIEALDVVRGFALIGIALMNIEYFNRTMSTMGTGMPTGLTGLDWLASYFIAYFVQGKFWTIFSTLFGMGFAIMLTRAESAGRSFLPTYLRRILGLAVFGAAHYLFLWNGDILFSYAVGACALLILLYGRWKPLTIAILGVLGISFIPGLEPLRGVTLGMTYVAFITLFLRGDAAVPLRGRRLPLFAFILGLIGTLAAIGAVLLWTLPGAPQEPRVPVTVLAVFALVLCFLATRYREPEHLRMLRLGAGSYVVLSLVGVVFTAVQYLTPPPADTPVKEKTPAVASASASASAASAAPVASAAASASAKAKSDAPLSEAEKREKKKKERAERLAKRERDLAEELAIMKSPSYLDDLMFRAREFPQKAANDAGFAALLIAMFLIGAWFVRAGVMENTRAHLPMFRKLAMICLPLGIGLGLAASLIATSHIPGNERSGYPLSNTLTMLGNLPASLGYISLVIVMLHSARFSAIRVLAPFGRMALTNYLTQSLICALVFYGYGLGWFGLPRAQQVLFVAVMVTLQIAFSHWWLARFQYGPMEWLWRGFTYRTMPRMRKETALPAAVPVAG